MSIWIILSWIFVIALTAINIIVGLKLKQASEQMLKMAFPGAKDMNDALSQMQGMMKGMGGKGGGMPRGGGKPPFPTSGRTLPSGGGKSQDAQLKAAMEMLQKMKKGK